MFCRPLPPRIFAPLAMQILRRKQHYLMGELPIQRKARAAYHARFALLPLLHFLTTTRSSGRTVNSALLVSMYLVVIRTWGTSARGVTADRLAPFAK